MDMAPPVAFSVLRTFVNLGSGLGRVRRTDHWTLQLADKEEATNTKLTIQVSSGGGVLGTPGSTPTPQRGCSNVRGHHMPTPCRGAHTTGCHLPTLSHGPAHLLQLSEPYPTLDLGYHLKITPDHPATPRLAHYCCSRDQKTCRRCKTQNSKPVCMPTNPP